LTAVVCAIDIPATQSIEVIDSPRSLDALGEHWSDLGAQRFGPVVSHDWYACAARAFAAGARLHVIAVWHDRRLAAVAPLARVRSRGIERLEFLGDRELFEPAQLLAADDTALGTLCEALVRQRLPLVLQRLEVDDPALRWLHDAARGRGTVRTALRADTHRLSQGTAWEQVGGSQAGYRRKLRKLQAFGAVTFTVESPEPAQLGPLLDEAIAVEARAWKARVGGALATNARLGGFFRDFCARLAARGHLRIAVLRVDGAAVAVQLCAEQDGRLWVLKMGYDEKYAACSPGLLLTTDLIRHALERRAAGFEFLGVAEDWQRPWNPQTRRHCALLYYPRTVAGTAALTLDTLGARVSRRARA
jgi:CelD/BcsL family acetyltransferase involved in cellulose biosynthesis